MSDAMRPGDAGTDPPGSDDPVDGTTRSGDPRTEGAGGEVEHDAEPNASGTLFIMIVFLMALAGMWGIMFFRMLER